MSADGVCADLSDWWKTGIFGPDALLWLDTLVSARVADLGPGRARRSLLLSPRGGVLAEFTVAIAGANVLLIQDPLQPHPAGELLRPLIGSWDVVVEDRGPSLALFAFPGSDFHPEVPGASYCSPSCLGPGADLVALSADRGRLKQSLSRAWQMMSEAELEAWRIENGRARVGIDVTIDEIPPRVGLNDAIDLEKSNFRGRVGLVEPVAQTTEPPALVRVVADGALEPGDELFVGEESRGRVTSAASSPNGTVALARVSGEHRRASFETAAGTRAETRAD